MKFIQNSAFLILFLFISGCGLIIDIACLATGRPGTQKPDSEKTDFERSMDKTRNEQDNWVRDQQRKFEEDIQRSRRESDERMRRWAEEAKQKQKN